MIRYSLLIDGRVQGVGFRYFAQMEADKFRLTGWCKNLFDGKVEIEIQGNESNIINFINSIKIGNHFSRVDSIDYNSINIIEDEKKFYICY